MKSDRKYTNITHRANNWPPVGIFKSGVVHDVIHIADLNRVELDSYKAIVFMNTFLLTPEQKKFIKNMVAKNGRNLIWLYAPGYSDGKTTSTSNISEVTGISMSKINPAESLSISVNPDIVADYTISINSIINPVFIVNDKQLESMGTIDGTSQIGFAKKKLAESTSWFFSLPPDNPKLWQYIFKSAGAHIYNEGGDIFYAGNNTLTIHTKDGGPKIVTLKNGKQVSLDLQPFSTIVLDPETGKPLLK
jgi:hypothetical protein